MGLPPRYHYRKKSRRARLFDVDRLDGITNPADLMPLTGFVNGMAASDIEERVARALRLLNVEFGFQVPFEVTGGLPEQDKNVDFVVQAGGMFIPIEVDGEIGHSTGAQQGKDAIRETLLNEVFRTQGLRPIVRVKWYDLETQEMADRAVRKLLGI